MPRRHSVMKSASVPRANTANVRKRKRTPQRFSDRRARACLAWVPRAATRQPWRVRVRGHRGRRAKLRPRPTAATRPAQRHRGGHRRCRRDAGRAGGRCGAWRGASCAQLAFVPRVVHALVNGRLGRLLALHLGDLVGGCVRVRARRARVSRAGSRTRFQTLLLASQRGRHGIAPWFASRALCPHGKLRPPNKNRRLLRARRQGSGAAGGCAPNVRAATGVCKRGATTKLRAHGAARRVTRAAAATRNMAQSSRRGVCPLGDSWACVVIWGYRYPEKKIQGQHQHQTL